MILTFNMKAYITHEDTFTEGDGIRTFYKNGIYINYEIIQSNEH
jgi:hypothetical protein